MTHAFNHATGGSEHAAVHNQRSRSGCGALLVFSRTADRGEGDLPATQLDLELIARLEAQLVGVGIADHQVAVELHLGHIAQAAACLTAALVATIAEAHTLGVQQGFIEGGELQPNAAIFLGAHVAALTHYFGLGGIVQLLEFGEKL
jgi:hypothetical protein